MEATRITPRPLDTLALPDDLEGRNGTNRAAGRSQIDANNDPDAISAWLAPVASTKNTFENYRKEAERLLLWSIVQPGKPLSSLTHEDLLLYLHFLADRNRRSAGSRASACFHGPLRAGAHSTGRSP